VALSQADQFSQCDAKQLRMNVLVIDYYNLGFVCNLVLEFWDFAVLLNY